jgi:hypothetical protein
MKYVYVTYMVERFGYGKDYRWRRQVLGIHCELSSTYIKEEDGLEIKLRVNSEQALLIALKYNNIKICDTT